MAPEESGPRNRHGHRHPRRRLHQGRRAALRDALWHNSLTVAGAVGKSSDDMQVEVLIGVPKPDQVDKQQCWRCCRTAPAR